MDDHHSALAEDVGFAPDNHVEVTSDDEFDDDDIPGLISPENELLHEVFNNQDLKERQDQLDARAAALKAALLSYQLETKVMAVHGDAYDQFLDKLREAQGNRIAKHLAPSRRTDRTLYISIDQSFQLARYRGCRACNSSICRKFASTKATSLSPCANSLYFYVDCNGKHLGYSYGYGLTDGESVERDWAQVNPVAFLPRNDLSAMCMDFFPPSSPFTVHLRGNRGPRAMAHRPRTARNNPQVNRVSPRHRLIYGGLGSSPPTTSADREAQRWADRDRFARRIALSSPMLSHSDRDERARLSRRARRDAANPPYIAPTPPARSPSATRVVRRYPDPRAGMRLQRAIELTHSELWAEGSGPEEQVAKKPHHRCSICHMTKSNPVSYICGHGHCYVCIRLWLERDWKCPDCATPMYRAPFRNYAEEDFLAELYPEWKDCKLVAYNWDGLVFPKPPKQVVVPDSP
ncbi:hypothetical protein C8R43DRAFT_1128489 [Mycena crocata]|nr:hypothetical protein C8R43DRAFT_1128489 [Mycena crocata]